MLIFGLLSYYNILLVTDVYLFVFWTIAFFYDGPATMHLTFGHTLTNGEIIDGPHRYWSPFCIGYWGCERVFRFIAMNLKDLNYV